MKLSGIVESKGEYHIGFRDKVIFDQSLEWPTHECINCFSLQEIVNIYGMFRTRSILYQKALRHKTVVAVEMM